MRFAPLQRLDPQFQRLEVHVAGPQRQRLAHAAAREREGARERLDGGFRVGPDRGEESLAFVGRQIFPAAVVDQADIGAWGHGAGLRGACAQRLPFP